MRSLTYFYQTWTLTLRFETESILVTKTKLNILCLFASNNKKQINNCVNDKFTYITRDIIVNPYRNRVTTNYMNLFNRNRERCKLLVSIRWRRSKKRRWFSQNHVNKQSPIKRTQSIIQEKECNKRIQTDRSVVSVFRNAE